MTLATEFAQQKYLVVKGLADPYLINFLESYYRVALAKGIDHFRRDGTSLNGYGEACADSVMYAMRQRIAQVTGLDLLPAFSFVRHYKRGEKLRRHIDRGANEINCTIKIFGATPWPLGVEVNGQQVLIEQDCGDGLIYKGLEIPHWRDVYAGEEHLQLILAYVQKDGSQAAWAFDGNAGPAYRPSAAHRGLKSRLMYLGAQLKRKLTGQPPLD